MNVFAENIINKIKVPTLLVVKIFIKPGNEYNISSLLLKLNKESNYDIKSLLPESQSIYSLLKKYKRKYPIILSLTGEGILTKSSSIESGKEFSIEDLPEYRNKELLINLYQTQSYVLYSVARVSKIQSIVSEIESNGNKVIDAQIGYSGLLQIKEHLESKKELIIDESKLSLRNKTLTINNGLVSSEESEVIVSGELISSSQLLAFLSVNLSIRPGQSFTSNQLFNDSIKYKWYKSAFFTSKVCFVSIVLLLLTGQIIKSFSNKYSKEISSESLVVQSVTSEIYSLSAQLNSTGKFIRLNNYDLPTMFSFYSDRIASILPGSVTLTHLSLFPGEQNKRSGEWNIQRNIISASGMANELKDVSILVASLNLLDWVEDTKVLSYSKNKKASLGEFEITIYITSK